MSYIIQRQSRFYVVVYDGIDPLTGKERRRWLPAGHDRTEAEAVAARVDADRPQPPPKQGGPITVAAFLTETWMPRKRRQVRAATAYRYAWFIDRYIAPAIGDIPMRRLRLDHLEQLYQQLAATGGRSGDGLAPKTIHEVHVIIRAALDLAVDRELVGRNVAASEQLKLPRIGGPTARIWTVEELAGAAETSSQHRRDRHERGGSDADARHKVLRSAGRRPGAPDRCRRSLPLIQ
jgi:hypothetical protein